jgi:8-oxo-dGTP pyrophosphatase MutT (NUDIX family)
LASDVVVDPSVEVPAVGVGEEWVVSAVIQDSAGRVFVQRRSNDRRLFPGCWDLVGGHVEPGEDLWRRLIVRCTRKPPTGRTGVLARLVEAVYAHCLDGHHERWFERLDAALLS